MAHLDALHALGCPVLIAASRKRFIPTFHSQHNIWVSGILRHDPVLVPLQEARSSCCVAGTEIENCIA